MSLRRVVLGGMVLAALAGCRHRIASSQVATDPSSVAAEPSSTAASLLWRVTGGDLEDTSWVFGTIHLIGRDDFVVKEHVKEALASCEAIAFEFRMNDLALAVKMDRLLRLPGGARLEDAMSADELELIQTWVRDTLEADWEDYATRQPIALLQAMVMRELDDQAPASFEFHFLSQALASGLSIHGLETVEDQMAIFDRIPLEKQIDWLVEGLDDEEDAVTWDSVVDAYLDEDLERLRRMIVEESPELDAYEDLFLGDRNRRWIPVIEKLASEGSTFVAVGAGHLAGPDGVLTLLRQAGYRVEPVTR